MRVVRVLASLCAVFALVLACVAGDPSASLSGDDSNDDAPAAFDASAVLPATRAEPRVGDALVLHGSVVVTERQPISRLSSLDIFRPPRALG